MPGPKTHDIFYKQLKGRLSNKTQANYSEYDKYNIFSQGHDFLLYNDYYKFWKLKQNTYQSILLQENNFSEFVFSYLDQARRLNSMSNEQTRCFIIGYITHHLLDSHMHPLIIYCTGDHTVDKSKETWLHGVVETLIDSYMMKKYEGNDSKTYKVYNDFKFDNVVDPKFLETLNRSLEKTYNIKFMGEKFKIAFYQTEQFIRILKYDPTGRKKKFFDTADQYFMGASAFSYHVDPETANTYLNEEHDEWINPYDDIYSSESIMDLYHRAMNMCAYIVDELDLMMQSESFSKDDIYSLIPNVSSITGLACGGQKVIRNTRVNKK